jgi:hypothetical protein
MNPEFLEFVRKSARGVSWVRSGERGVFLSRLPEWTYAQHAHAEIVGKMAERLSGARLALNTSATAVTVRYRSVRDVNLADGYEAGPSVLSVTSEGFEQSIAHSNGDRRVWNGEVIQSFIEGEDSIATFELPEVQGPRAVQIWLPHNCPIEIIEVTGNAPINPDSSASKPRWVHYGSSISHCEDAETPLGVWPVDASRRLGLEIYNLALGGCANLEQFSARTIRDMDFEFLSLKLGINVVNGANMTSRTFGPAVHGFIDTIRERHPLVPILIISPVCCPAHENNPGPSETSPDGLVMGQPHSRHTWIGELTLRSIRETLNELVNQRSKSDANIYYLDGLKLFNETEALTMPDGIHPDSAGYQRIADNFVAHHPSQWLKVSHAQRS